MPTLTPFAVSTYLIEGYALDQGDLPASWASPNITVNINALSQADRVLAMRAMELIEDVSVIDFQIVAGGAQISYNDNGNNTAVTNTNYSYSAGASTGTLNSATITISQNWAEGVGAGQASYRFSTFIHETLHAVGLGHGGDYNFNANYPTDAHYDNDSWQMSVMSYFDQVENTAINATYAFALTPQIADIIALERLYGADTTTRNGNDTYGVGNTTQRAVYTANQNSGQLESFTIYDTGGIDTLNYSGTSATQLINLNDGQISSVYNETGNLIIAENTMIENAIGGSGQDTLIGNESANSLQGGAGNDVLVGISHSNFSAKDVFDGGIGDDTFQLYITSRDVDLIGHTGFDTLALKNQFYFGAGDNPIDGQFGAFWNFQNTIVDSIERLEFQTSSHGGTSEAKVNADQFGTQSGGGTGFSNSLQVATTSLIGNAEVQVSLGSISNFSAANWAIQSNNVSLLIIGGVGNDTILGSTANDTIAGSGGIDVLRGGSGNDTFYYSDANDIDGGTIDGGQGTDSILIQGFAFDPFDFRSTDVTSIDKIVVSDELSQPWISEYKLLFNADGLSNTLELDVNPLSNFSYEVTFELDTTTVLDVSNFTLTDWNAENKFNLHGSGSSDLLRAHSGSDQVFGNDGADSLYGEAGNDMLFGGAGADLHDGGAGIDYARYNDAAYGNVTASLGDPSRNTNVAVGDTYVGIEGLIMGTGNDRAFGDGGNNFLFGMQGNDSIWGGAGADRHIGGAGFDFARYDDAAHGNIIVSLNKPTSNTNVAAGDTFIGIEGLITGSGNDRLTGDNGDNTLIGARGNDMLSGGAGADVLNGGDGFDYVRYDDANHGDLTVSLVNTFLNTGAATGDSYIGIEGMVLGAGNDSGQGSGAADFIFGMSGTDVLSGQGGNDRLNGGAGDDRLVGGGLDDRLTGGSGADVFVFRVNYDRDVIWDFSGAGIGGGEGDRIDLRGVFDNFAELEAATNQVGADIEISVNANDILTVRNYLEADLTSADVLF